VRQLAAALLVCASLLAACGGDDDNGSDAPTREEYIARADAFCKKGNAEAKRINERAQAAASGVRGAKAQIEAVAPIFDEGYELQRRLLDEFKKIPYPPEDRKTIQELHAAGEQLTALVKELGEAARAGDVNRFRSISAQQDRIRSRTRVIQREYGFRECGSGSNEAD
jgi:predicted lipid-binding transport protein (Tim44 family)